ncbi:MAG: TolC family protein [Gemmatimonadota bacterium]
MNLRQVRRTAALVLMGLLAGVSPLATQEITSLEQLLGLEGIDPVVLPLDEAIATALERNRDVREARLQVEQAAGQVSEAWGEVFPRIDLNASWTRNISPPVTFLPAVFFDPDRDPDDLVPVAFGRDNAWSSNLSFEQPLFEARAFVGVGAASRFEALQDEELRGRIHQVITEVRVSYYELLLAEEQARLIDRSVRRVVESLEETRALERAGLVSAYDVLRLEVELANLEPQLRRAANEALRTERDLVSSLDLPEGTRLRVVGHLAELHLDQPGANSPENQALLEMNRVDLADDADPAALTELLERARVNSSSMQQAGLNRELRHAELRASQAELLPTVSLFGNYQIQAQQDGGPAFFGGQRGYGRLIGVQVTVPIFSGRQRLARIDQGRSALRIADLQVETAHDLIRDELRNVLNRIEEARLRSRGQRLAVQQATRGFEIVSAQYREGLSGHLELTDAEVALRQSEFNYAEAVYDYLQARAELDELVGEVPLPGR